MIFNYFFFFPLTLTYYYLITMSFSKKNSTVFLFTLFALLLTFMGDFVTAAPIGSIDSNEATLTCK